jgi:hypothetical protein
MSQIINFLRQIHPIFVCNNVVSGQAFAVDKQAFTPTTKDEGKLSTYDGAKFSYQGSYEHYTKELKSAGVMGITEAECTVEGLPFTYDTVPFDGHCSIDFNGKTKSEKRICANSLRDYASNRGWLYQPE